MLHTHTSLSASGAARSVATSQAITLHPVHFNVCACLCVCQCWTLHSVHFNISLCVACVFQCKTVSVCVSVLDMARHVPLYKALLELLRSVAVCHVLVPLLLPLDRREDVDTDGDGPAAAAAATPTASVCSLLQKMKGCVDTYASRLKWVNTAHN